MQYLGGKSKIAKDLARIIQPKGLCWEPFCGGLSMSVQLAKYGPGLVSDAHPALIALYQAVRAGWQPPEVVTEADYQAAKGLPDSDPLKAFVGFGCSFGGKFFGGYARASPSRNYPRHCARSLARDIPSLARCQIEHLSFLDQEPTPGFDVIYCDPPYWGTTGYSTGSFDHTLFWARCVQWAQTGSRVFVSEYTCLYPSIVDEVWTKKVLSTVGVYHEKVEKLYQVRP
jgi:DNA adenine methylase